MHDVLGVASTFLAGLAGWLLFRWRADPVSALSYDGVSTAEFIRHAQLRSIPTLGGSSLPGLSFLTALNFVQHGGELLAEGYKKVCRFRRPSMCA